MEAACRLAFVEIIDLIADGYGNIDVACPECGPSRRSPANQRRKTLRIWREESDFARYYCVRCELKGYARRDDGCAPIDLTQVARLRSDAAARNADREEEQHRKANRLWRSARPAQGTIVQTYLIARGTTALFP